MANLNIPFVLLDKSTCNFRPAINTSTIIHHSKFNLNDAKSLKSPLLPGQQEVSSSSGLYSYISGALSSIVPGISAEDTISTKQFKTPIPWNDTKQNLLVLADEQTGTLALCSHEQHGTDSQVPRLLVNIQPRVLCVPSIMAGDHDNGGGRPVGPLLSHCVVRCPAPNLLSGSTFWLLTLHTDQRLRLWNTNDGRCVSISSESAFDRFIVPPASDEDDQTKLVALCSASGFPGQVFVFSDIGDVFTFNVYKMQVQQHIQVDGKGFAGCEYIKAANTLVFCDAIGAVFVLHDSNHAANNRIQINEHSIDAEQGSSSTLRSSMQITEEVKRQSSARDSKRSQNMNSNTGSGTSADCQKRMLKFCRNERAVNFRFKQVLKMGGRETLEVKRLKQSQVLAYDFDIRTKMVAIIVTQDRIEQVLVGQSGEGVPYTRQALKELQHDTIFVFAQFVTNPKSGQKVLVCIDKSCKVSIYALAELQRPKFELSEEEKSQIRFNLVQPLMSFDLLDQCQVTDYHQIWLKDTFNELVSEYSTKEQYRQSRLNRLKEHLLERFEQLSSQNIALKIQKQTQCTLFRYSQEEQILYSFVDVNNKNVLCPQQTSLLLSWDMNKVLSMCEDMAEGSSAANIRLPLNISNLTLFGSQSKQSDPSVPNCLINFNPQMTKQFYNSTQFRFFFTDEKVTSKTIFHDNQSPSEVIGTNYGRIFMIPMFQEQQFKHVLPSLLIDSHKGSPITKLYIAYQGAQWASEEGGGNLLSVSEDGSICVTDLCSEEIVSKLHAKGANQQQTSAKRRTDQFVHEKSKNMRQKRRHSVSQYFSTDEFFKFERVRATEVFDEVAFSDIKHVFRIKTIQEAQDFLINDRTRQQPKLKLELPKQYYAFITKENELIVLAVHANQKVNKRFSIIKVPSLSEPTLGVYFDQGSQNLFILTESLEWRQFCLRSQSLSHRKRTVNDALSMLEVPQLIGNLQQNNENFFKVISKEDNSPLSYENFQKDFNKSQILRGLGTHQCLDFLNLSLSMPISYAPQSHVLKEYTNQLRHLLSLKSDILGFSDSEESQKNMLRAVNQILNWENDRIMKSDVTRKQASIVSIETQGKSFCGSNQTVLIASTQQILPALQNKMKRVKAKRENPNFYKDLFDKQQNDQEESKGLNAAQSNRAKTEARPVAAGEKDPSKLINTTNEESPDRNTVKPPQQQNSKVYGMERYRWPSKILSLVHPFDLHPGMDESLEEFFNLNMPFLDFYIGIQGIDEAFSFIISKEDRNYHNERDHISKIMSLFKLSHQLQKIGQATQKTLIVENLIEQHLDPQDSTLYLGRFFNSEYWKVSPYLSTIIPAFLLSAFVSIIEYDEKEICLLSQVWLDIVHHIRNGSRYNQSCASSLSSPKKLSTSVLSQLLLVQDLNVSSCAKDIIFKPILCHQSQHDKKELQAEISDWLALVIDTYEELKQETTSGKPEDGSSGNVQPQKASRAKESQIGGEGAVENIMRMSMAPGQNPYLGAQAAVQSLQGSGDISPDQIGAAAQVSTENRPLSHFFGEMEIKGLINVSFYAFYCQVELNLNLGQRDLDRVSKLVVILIREVVKQFQDRKDHNHLLTILLYLLQCNLKTAQANFKRKAIMDDVVRLLLFIFNYHKPPLNHEVFITRVTSENFNLIRPTNSELYLKLVAAKTLLEIGVSFTEDFLQLIQFHATTLRPSQEHQKNVLETLRYFINGYGENLEKYLIQIVQILLRCLDPNELALRKNSHKYVSVILSNMVKIFPMVAFHYDTQRLAVGTHDGPIGIYDVRTSAKWKILEGHTKNVTCLCFDSKGNYLASYSAIDLTLKLWKVGNTSFFATIMGGTGRFAKQIKLDSFGPNVHNPHVHQTHGANHIEMENRDRKFHEHNDVSKGAGTQDEAGAGQGSGAAQSSANQGNRISKCHIRFMRNDKDVELTREDGSKELHSLIK